MVAGKVKQAMGLQKSPKTTEIHHQHYPQQQQRHSPSQSQSPSPSNASSIGKVPQKGAMFSRSFGVYFPRSSAQVQPRPPDVTELLHLVEELRERESRLRTQLLEQKLLKESVAILPVLENEMARKDAEILKSVNKIECLEAENERLRQEVEMLHSKLKQQKQDFEIKLKESSSASQRFQQLMDISGKSNIIKSLKRNPILTTKNQELDSSSNTTKCYTESSAKESILIEIDNLPRLSRCDSLDMSSSSSSSSSLDSSSLISIRSRIPRVPKPPPRPSTSSSVNGTKPPSPPPPPPPPPPPQQVAKPAPPPPPPPPRPTPGPPPPPKNIKPLPAKVRRVPEVVEFYHSLMRRDSRRDSCAGASSVDAPSTTSSRDMIGEIENRSTHLLAIKTDVETQGDFIRFLIKEVENASFTNIEDVVPFVKWLDDELSYLVDERAVLKHFKWPEHKADALREAAFGYSDLKKLESEVSSFRDDPRQHSAPALKKMQGLFEKLEHGVYNLSRMRESASTRYKVFHIPMDWMQETGFVAQIKLASVKLAMKYMRRVSAELETVGGGPEEEELIVQGVRFAFRVHQFAGGFDVETMRAFQELRDKANSCHEQQQKPTVC